MSNKSVIYGYGFIPLLKRYWIGPSPFSEGNDSDVYIEASKIICEGIFRKYPLFVTKAGIFGLIGEDRSEIRKALNSFVALGAMTGFLGPTTVNEHDLIKFAVDTKKKEIVSSSRFAIQEFSRTSWLWVKIVSERIEKDEFAKLRFKLVSKKQIEEEIKAINEKPDVPSEALSLWLESQTLLEEGDYQASFFLAWTLIEGLLTFFWKEFLEENFKGDIKPGDQENMWDSPVWPISVKIRSLQVTAQIPHSLANLANRIRRLRNNLIHKYLFKDVKILAKNAEIAVDLGELLLQRLMGIKNWKQLDSKFSHDN